jgi:hypothetical protein
MKVDEIMLKTVLMYNKTTGRFGIRDNYTGEWINKGLSHGDKVVIYDHFNGYYLEDEIQLKTLKGASDEWYFKKTNIECKKNIEYLVLLEN